MMHTAQKTRSSYSTDPFLFGRYYLLNIIGYGIATAVVLHWNGLFETTSPWWLLSLTPLFFTRFRYIVFGALILSALVIWQYGSEISWVTGMLVLVAVYVGHLTAVFIHNAAHKNFKPYWLNEVIGEICALQQLSAGLLVFRFIHSQHHAFPDDPLADPHPPKGYTFWQFIDVARLLIGRRLEEIYLKNWGNSTDSRKRCKQQNVLLLASRFTKTLFVFSLLGPKLFVLLFLPSYISNVFLFAAFNYFTHRELPDGSVEVRNLAGNPYYDLCNRILFGVMYHKNHHIKPRAFNPQKAIVQV